jgi:hypothetical protein
MTFDIHQLDNVEFGDSMAEQALNEYQDAVLDQFINSPEGQARLEADPGLGFWAAQLIDYGYSYIGVTLPQMRVRDINEIVTGLFPRKITVASPETVEDTIPELLAFWRFLKSAYGLTNAEPILQFLNKIEPEFKTAMNDPSNFGMAKSLVTMGQAAGFDMTNPDECNAFVQQYNANRALNQTDSSLFPFGGGFDSISATASVPRSSKASAKRRRLRKIAKKSRRANKQRRK